MSNQRTDFTLKRQFYSSSSEVWRDEMNLRRIQSEIEGFIRGYVEKSKAEGVVLGVSGGVDSSTVAILCSKAVGPERVLALIMPEEGVTEHRDVDDAIEICEIAGIEHRIIDISPFVNAFLKNLEPCGEIPRANIKPRVRMILNYYHANCLNRIVAGTGNKSELMVGYFTKYGDGGCDILPIGDLYKTEVLKLAEFVGVPERIIRKKPSAGLWRGQTDEEEIGMSYEELDKILIELERGSNLREISEKSGIASEKIERVLFLIRENEHKRVTPPVAELRHLLS
jgi:NAD+ synthase